jgi:hypothetical protein
LLSSRQNQELTHDKYHQTAAKNATQTLKTPLQLEDFVDTALEETQEIVVPIPILQKLKLEVWVD